MRPKRGGNAYRRARPRAGNGLAEPDDGRFIAFEFHPGGLDQAQSQSQQHNAHNQGKISLPAPAPQSLPGAAAKLAQAIQIAERLRKSVSELKFNTSSGQVRVTVSVGVAVLEKDDNLETLIKKADKALYRAKEVGRNNVGD